MSSPTDFSPEDIRLMQGLARKVSGLRPEVVNNGATVGQLAWAYGKDNATLGSTWRRRLWSDAGEVLAWGWIFLPYKVKRSDGQFNEVKRAHMAWQVHPERPELLDEVLDWYDTEASGADRTTDVRAADKDALLRLAAHGYQLHEQQASDDGYWQQMNTRELTDLEQPVLPTGFRFRTAGEAGAEAAVQAHVDAWHPSSFTSRSYEGVRAMWPYREDLHILVEAPDGTMASTAIIWLDPHNRSAEFEPVGTHQAYQQRGLGKALLQHGLHVARAAGAIRMTVSCLGGAAHQAARGLYHSVGFRPFTQDAPQIKHAPHVRPGAGNC